MTKRTYVIVGTGVYVAAIVLPFVVLTGIGIWKSATLDFLGKDSLQMEHERVMTWSAARITAFLDWLTTGGITAVFVAVLGGVPFALYLAIVNMLSSCPRTAAPPPIQDFEM